VPILKKAMSQSGDPVLMLVQSLTGASMARAQVRFDLVGREADVQLQNEVYRHHSITVARMIWQRAFEKSFGLFASGERCKLIDKGQMIGATDLRATVPRADFADVDFADLQSERPRDHGMTCLVIGHTAQIVCGFRVVHWCVGHSRIRP
jgi:hypothetical protein